MFMYPVGSGAVTSVGKLFSGNFLVAMDTGIGLKDIEIVWLSDYWFCAYRFVLAGLSEFWFGFWLWC